MVKPADDTASPLHDEWRDLLADIEDLIKRVSGLDDAVIAKIRDLITAKLGGVKARMADGAEQVRDVAGTVDDYVHNNPWQSLGVAAVIGLLFGLMLSSRD